MRHLALISLLLCALIPSAFAMREFSISGLQCQTLTCETREGIMPHQLTTVEISGSAKQWAGYSLLFKVIRQNDKTVVVDRRVGVMANGGFTTSIPAYSFEDGAYVFGFMPVSTPTKAIAAGTFTVGPLGQSSAQKTTARPPSGKLAGHWLGIAGTFADLTINPDGTYISGGSAHGTWRQEGDTVIFTGPLTAWNDGHGKLKPSGDVIEFYWTNAAGAKQYFVIGKY